MHTKDLRVQNSEIVLVLLTYNHADCVADAISDMLEQKQNLFNLLIIDDNSTDNTWEVISLFAKRDNRIKAYRNEKNLGGSGNFNYAAKKSLADHPNAEFFTWIGPDDRYSDDWLSSLVTKAREYPEGAIFQSYCIYDFGTYSFEVKFEDLVHPIKPLLYANIIQHNYGQLLHGIWRRNVMQHFADYSITSLDIFFKLEPYSICYLLQSGSFHVVKKPLMTKRKYLSSNFRYPDDELYGNISITFPKQAQIILRILPKLVSQENSRFLFFSLLINFSITVRDSVKYRTRSLANSKIFENE
jgi:glycosyltransferase involved in cell wall biosynthesis